jgi:hypothetical protein
MSAGQLDLVAVCREFQTVLEQHLGLSRASIPHSGTQGGVTEDRWIAVLRDALPRRYDVARALVLDSNGCVSEQIDCVVFDPQYTPTLFNQEQHRFVAAEAVYAILEVKPNLNKETLEYAGQKAASVRGLHRTSTSIPHAGGTYPPKPIFPILAGIVALESDWSDGLGTTFAARLSELPSEHALELGCVLRAGAFEQREGALDRVPADRSLMWFLFRLLARLQALGTVPAIDWTRYAAALHEPKR